MQAATSPANTAQKATPAASTTPASVPLTTLAPFQPNAVPGATPGRVPAATPNTTPSPTPTSTPGATPAANTAAVQQPAATLNVTHVISGQGYWNITGTSGAIAIHALYTINETVLFLERPHNPQPPNPNLLVSRHRHYLEVQPASCCSRP